MSSQGAGQSRAAQRRKKRSSTNSISDHSTLKKQRIDSTPSSSSIVKKSSNKPCNVNEILYTSFQEISTISFKKDCNYINLSSSLLSFLISPSDIESFYEQYWHKSFYHCSRESAAAYLTGLFTKKDFEQLVKTHLLYKDKDVTFSSVSNGVESIEGQNYDQNNDNETSEVEEELIEIKTIDIWKEYDNGYSIQLLCPQVYNDNIWRILSLLEIEFESVVGSHVVLSPLNGKGFGKRATFADFFILQIQGDTRWKVYSDAVDNGVSADTSSGSVNEGEKEVYTEVHLQQGQSLYIPKNTFIEDFSSPRSGCDGSMYLIIYTNEADSYPGLLEMVLPLALQETLAQSLSSLSNPTANGDERYGGSSVVSIPRSLPRHHSSFLGVAHSELEAEVEEEGDGADQNQAGASEALYEAREGFMTQLKQVLKQVASKAADMTDAAVDQVCTTYLTPPYPTILSYSYITFLYHITVYMYV